MAPSCGGRPNEAKNESGREREFRIVWRIVCAAPLLYMRDYATVY